MSGELLLSNGQAAPLSSIPNLSPDRFFPWLLSQARDGGRLSALFGAGAADGAVRLFAVVAFDRGGRLAVAACDAPGSYRSLTPDWPQAHMFERELFEQWSIRPEGHPWLKPVRYADMRRGDRERPAPAVTDFFRVEGTAVHEVAVGPIHAGVIEPGHFRFQCHGERVFHLEIALGFQHRGIERALAGGPDKRTAHFMETAAGDTTIGHSTAYAQIVEALAGIQAPPRAQALRAVALELERLANHVGDLGAMAGDTGYLPTSSFCGRLRGDYLNLTALFCGNRFGRSLVRPGGVIVDADEERLRSFASRLDATYRDTLGALRLLRETPSVLARFEHTGTVPRATAEALGLVGPAGRASNLDRDVRRDFPSGHYLTERVKTAIADTGDVQARAVVRQQEVDESVRFIRAVLAGIPEGPVRHPAFTPAASAPLAPDSLAIALVEGWRGELCHVAMTDSQGRIAAYKMVDPSFHNWPGLAMALRDQQISDFPLCNKSFNLSYCGHDL